ncbi:MAG TPA: PIN domain-containing protein [Patescibacteria group bacterium]
MDKKTEQLIKPEVLIAAANSPKVQAVPQHVVGNLADEIAKTLIKRLPNMFVRDQKKKNKIKKEKRKKEAEGAIFLDTSAIIDGRIFDVIDTGILSGYVIVPEFILLELKHIADSQDMVKRERGRRGLEALEKVKKSRRVKAVVIPGNEKTDKLKEVDEKLIALSKFYKGRLVTCDYNLEKKASVGGVVAVNVHELANRLKVRAVPGESLHIKVQHIGKDLTQGVGYLDDGTMVVIEMGSNDIDKFLNVVVSRVIQTSSGRILFAKKI